MSILHKKLILLCGPKGSGKTQLLFNLENNNQKDIIESTPYYNHIKFVYKSLQLRILEIGECNGESESFELIETFTEKLQFDLIIIIGGVYT